MFRGKECAIRGAAEDDIADGEAVRIDLAGPYEASMGGSAHLLMFVDIASRWMRVRDEAEA